MVILHELKIIEVSTREGRIDGELVTLAGGGCPAAGKKESSLYHGRRKGRQCC